MKTNLKNLIILTMVSIGILFLSGCKTMEGLGKDIQKGGQHLEKAAKQDSNGTNGNGA